MEVLDVTHAGTLISCFNSMVEQNSIYFVTSELIMIFPLEVFTFFSNKFMPSSTNISLSNLFLKNMKFQQIIVKNWCV